MPKVAWTSIWVPQDTPVGSYLNTPVPSLPLTEGLYLYCPYSPTLACVPWGTREHNGACVIARTLGEAEYLLALLVSPDLAIAYDHLQRRQPSPN